MSRGFSSAQRVVMIWNALKETVVDIKSDIAVKKEKYMKGNNFPDMRRAE